MIINPGRHVLISLVAVIASVLIAPAGVAAEDASQASDVVSLKDIINAVDLQTPRTRIADNFPKPRSMDALYSRKAELLAQKDELAKSSSKLRSRCEAISAAYLNHLIDIELNRVELETVLPDLMAQIRETGRLEGIANSEPVYDHLVRHWLGQSIDPDWLMEFGRAELAAALNRYRELQKQLGFEGDDAGLADYLAQPQFREADFDRLGTIFKHVQKDVRVKMADMFHPHDNASPAEIVRSNRGQAFRAFGYYIPEEKTFYYNPLEDTFDLNKARWLFIHEGSPGHHYFFQVGQGERGCKLLNQLPSFYAYLEGWAAYTETLGADLGAFDEPESELSAISWDMVRSARVVLDVGLNVKGWTEQQALDFWYANLPGQDDIAQREIDRVRDWPVQAITYKFGAAEILRLREKMTAELGHDFDIRDFHDLVLEYGDIPFDQLETNIDHAIQEKRSRKKEKSND